MTIEVEDVLKVDLVLVGLGLLNQPSELDEFRKLARTDVVVSGLGISVGAQTNITETGRTLSLPKDRIVLNLASSRSTIRRDYPQEKDLDRLAEVATHAITKTSSQLQSLQASGYNVDLVYDQKSGQTASQYLARRLLSKDLSHNESWQLVGGASRIIFEEGERQWTIAVEPRFNEPGTTRVFLTLNLHISNSEHPLENDIKDSLREAWREAHDFAHWLDERCM